MLRNVCRRFRTFADALLAKQVTLLLVRSGDAVTSKGLFSLFTSNGRLCDSVIGIFALAPPEPGRRARLGPMLGYLNTLQSRRIAHDYNGGVIDVAFSEEYLKLHHSPDTVRLRSGVSLQSVKLSRSSIRRLVRFIVVTANNDPFIDNPSLPRYIGKLVYHVSFDSSTRLVERERLHPQDNCQRHHVVFILSDRAEGEHAPTARREIGRIESSLALIVNMGICWYAQRGACVTVVGMESTISESLLDRDGIINPRAARERFGQRYANNGEELEQWLPRIKYISHEKYRADFGLEEYVMETVE